MDESPEDLRRASRARVLVASGALLSGVGIALAGSLSRGLGGALVAVGWLVLVGGIHTYGRLGSRSGAASAPKPGAPAV